MSKLLITFLALTSLCVASEKFYISTGTQIPMEKSEFLTRSQRALISIGIGTRASVAEDHIIDIGVTLLNHLVLRDYEVAMSYLFQPKELFGGYVGVGGFIKERQNIWFDQFHSWGYRVVVGYEFFGSSDRSSFLEVGFDRNKNLSLKSGLVF